MATPVELTADSFHTHVTEDSGAVLVDFWSHTCPHCQHFNPAYAEAAERGYPGVQFAKVAAQDAMPLFSEHGVSAVPTLVLFRDGAEVAREPGAKSAEDVLNWLKSHLPEAP